MSSQRHRSGETNILAMLEGQTGRPLARRLLALPPALWFGAAGLAVCALVGTLTWLALDTGPATSTLAAAPSVPAPAAEETVLSVPPPLISNPRPVELAQAAPDRPAAPETAPQPDPAAAAPQPSSSVIPRPASIVRVTAPRAPMAHPGARTAAVPRASAVAGHVRRAAAARTRSVATEVDMDVALISAIIQHGPVRQPVTSDGCADHPCGTVLPDRP